MEDYRVTNFDPSNMTVTIQFGAKEPFNHALPVIDGKLPTGELWNFWVACLCQSFYNTRDAEIPNVTNAADIEAIVNPTVLPYTTEESEYIQPPVEGLESF
jgi:hypothetical protein